MSYISVTLSLKPRPKSVEFAPKGPGMVTETDERSRLDSPQSTEDHVPDPEFPLVSDLQRPYNHLIQFVYTFTNTSFF